MAHLSTFVFSEDSKEVLNRNGQGTSLHIINPQNVFRPMFVPGAHSFSVTLGINGLDTSHKNSFQLIIRPEAKGSEATVNTDEIPLPPNPEGQDPILPKEAVGMMFNLDFRNVPFKIAGKYIAEIFVNGKLIEDKPLYVYPMEQ
ncbi:hypothetical protein QP042_21755 [Bacillus bombysepticus]|nr:hypothetical protein QP042_21755 [Bacillus bombysepticus]